MKKVSSKRVVDAMQEKDGGNFHQINSRDATSIGDFSFGLDFVQPEGKCKHVELPGTKSDKVNP